MRILIVGNTFNTPLVRSVAASMGIDLTLLSSQSLRTAPPEGSFDALLAGSDHGDHGDLRGSPLLERCRLIVPLSGENIAAGLTDLPHGDVELLNQYFAYGGPRNLRCGFTCVQQLLSGQRQPLPAPQPVPLDSIYTFDGRFFDSAAAFLQDQARPFPVYVGILSYRGRWADGDLALERAMAESLERRGIGVILAYSDGSPDAQLGTLPFQEAVRRFFCDGDRPVIDLLVNFQFFGAKAGNGQDMFAQAADCYAGLDIPVLRPAGLNRYNESQWRERTQPYAADLSINFVVPELQGMIEPVHVSCADELRCRKPIGERVERLTGRIQRWLRLRCKANSEKRVAIMLHNAPCSGVEATVGMATDLDAFESAVQLLRRLAQEGYTVTDIPEDGQALKDLIFQKKAISDFRWTAAENIAACGGALYRMDREEYGRYYAQLSDTARQLLERHWGPPPGEAMVVEDRLLITGIPFGNVLVMVQPKRGCYGAKCTGEVCKILQDPTCPPSHQFLATYWYLAHSWDADAVVHMGTHGSLEYLPGKTSGLSADCFPDIAIGDLINLYPYNASVISQALIARRRSYAVTLSYLPAPGKGLSADQRRIAELIGQYFAAQEQQTGQAPWLRGELEKLCQNSPAAQSVLSRESDFDGAMRTLRAMLTKTQSSRRGSGHRALGAAPDEQWIRDYISELWSAQPETAALWRVREDTGAVDPMGDFIHRALTDPGFQPEGAEALLAEDARDLAAALHCADAEMNVLLRALSGGFVRPTQGGDAAYGGRAILPTGRNIHGGEQDKVPTPAAYERGRQAAAQLLERYRTESGALPEKVAMNMTSLDVTRTGGEQLGQFLSLLGVRPVWSPSGRVDSLECVPLAQLGRPRVDVTAHISSVLRDAWPDVLTLMDRAVRLAEEQEEPEEDNLVRANSRRIRQSGEDGSGRIFGGQPGTYTSAVGLALKASAWKSEDDLAKYFIDASSYLYGEDKHGIRATGAFAANVRQVDLTCDITSSRRTDAVASSYSARVQGGFALAARALGSKKQIRQYMGESTAAGGIRVVTMADHVSRAIEDTLLNDVWREQMLEQGYQGAAELMERMQNIFDTQCVCENIAPGTLDAIAQRYLLDEDMQRWFRENNPHALEEASRRFLELNTRGKWDGDSQVLQRLRRAYLQAEGDLEDGVSGLGELQAGNVDIIAHDQVDTWAARLKETEGVLDKWRK